MMIGELDRRPGMFVFGEQRDMLRHKHFHADEYIEHRVHAGFVLRVVRNRERLSPPPTQM